MRATCHENSLEVTDDLNAFYERIGVIYSYLELLSLGFDRSETFCGFFTGRQVAELVAFCEKDPCYHIVTITDQGRFENRYVPGKRCYYLADGDQDPHLVLNLFLTKNAELFAEESFAKAFAVVPHVDRGDK